MVTSVFGKTKCSAVITNFTTCPTLIGESFGMNIVGLSMIVAAMIAGHDESSTTGVGGTSGDASTGC